jgi:uncharacterized lipoprotein
MSQFVVRLVVIGAAAVLLGGCSLFGGRSSYDEAQETRPLEIPPGLDAPAANATMSVPRVDGAPAPVASSSSNSSVPQSISAGADSSLTLGDSVAGAWRRVGLALERSGVGELVSRDETAATFTLTGTSMQQAEPEGGFFKRMFSSDPPQTSTTVTRVVRIVADGSGSVVRMEDADGASTDDEFSRRVIAAIRQRLG